MNVVYLSPHFPPQYHQFCRHLKQAGAGVLGIADAQYHDLAPEVRAALTEYYRVQDMHDYDALLRACGNFTHACGLLKFALELPARPGKCLVSGTHQKQRDHCLCGTGGLGG